MKMTAGRFSAPSAPSGAKAPVRGMSTSRKRRSGARCGAMRMTSSPSAHSPAISMSRCRSKKKRTLWRASGSSSTINARMDMICSGQVLFQQRNAKGGGHGGVVEEEIGAEEPLQTLARRFHDLAGVRPDVDQQAGVVGTLHLDLDRRAVASRGRADGIVHERLQEKRGNRDVEEVVVNAAPEGERFPGGQSVQLDVVRDELDVVAQRDGAVVGEAAANDLAERDDHRVRRRGVFLDHGGDD